MESSEDAVFRVRRCSLDLTQQVFRNIVAIGDSHALLHTEDSTITLSKQTGNCGVKILGALRPRNDIGEAPCIAGIRVRRRRQELDKGCPKLFHCLHSNTKATNAAGLRP